MIHYKMPMPQEYDTLEQYEEAMRLWEWAEDEYAEYYRERKHSNE